MNDETAWLLARSTGVAAVVLLTASVALGLALSLKLTSAAWPRALTNGVHRYVTNLALWATGAHVLLLLLHSQSGVSLTSTLVPFTSSYAPVAVALGTLALYGVAAVWASSLLRDRIGHALWRRIHYGAFAAWGAAMLHGVLAGTDTGELWTTALYVAAVILVGGLTAARVAAARRRRATASGAPRAATRRAVAASPAQQPTPADARLGTLPRLHPRPGGGGGGLPPLPGATPPRR